MSTKQLVFCHIFKWHNWTTAVQEGIEPSIEQCKTTEGFWEYAKMYCKECRYVYPKSLELIEDAKRRGI